MSHNAEPRPPLDPGGLPLVGGIVVANLSTYRRKTILAPVMKGGKPIKRSGPVERNRPKISRNSPCPCGSGRKVKNCCADKWL